MPNLTTALGRYRANRPALTDGQEIELPLNSQGQLLVAVASGSSSSPIAEYKSPDDFTASFVNSTTLVLSGLQWVPSSEQFVYIRQVQTDTTSHMYFNGVGNVTFVYNSTNGYLTIYGAGAVFVTGDTYEVGINGQRKSFDPYTNTTPTLVYNPNNQQVIEGEYVDSNAIASGINYYPSSLGDAMLGYKDLSLTGKLIDTDGTTTLTLEVTNDEDATNADWVQVYGTDKRNNLPVTSYTCTATTIIFAWDFTDFNFRYYRVKVVTSDGTNNTAIIKYRKKA